MHKHNFLCEAVSLIVIKLQKVQKLTLSKLNTDVTQRPFFSSVIRTARINAPYDCTTAVDNTAQNSSDNLHSYHHSSDIFYWREWRDGSDRVI